MASITIKTPKRSINLPASKKNQLQFFDELENNISKLCVSSNAKVAINISNGGIIAPIMLNRNMFDLLSFKNSISMNVNIESP